MMAAETQHDYYHIDSNWYYDHNENGRDFSRPKTSSMAGSGDRPETRCHAGTALFSNRLN